MPKNLPARADLRTAIQELDNALEPASNPHIAYCMILLAKTLVSRKGDIVDWTIRATGWITACGELPADLWTEATETATTTLKWFPAPADFMKCNRVGETWELRKRMLKRAEAILAIVAIDGPKTPTETALQPRTEESRHLEAVWRGWDWKTNQPHAQMTARLWESAKRSERWLAQHHDRPPADWSLDGFVPSTKPRAIEAVVRIPDSPATRKRLLPALIAKAKSDGRYDYADKLQIELDGTPVITDIPEGDDFGEGEDIDP